MSDSLASLYQQLILDHAKARHGYGTLERADAEQHQINPTCGDEITVQIALDSAGTLDQFGWHGAGCSISMASVSVLSDLAPGKNAEQLSELIGSFRTMLRSKGELDGDDELGDAVAFQGVSKYVMRIKCAMLGWVALEGCLTQLRSAPSGSEPVQ